MRVLAAALKGQIKMGRVIVTLRIMPENPETSLELIRRKAEEIIKEEGASVGKHEIEPVAFGLNALVLYVVVSDEQGWNEDIERQIKEIDGVESVNVADVRRAVG